MNRADLMHRALRSGDWRSRHDIFRDCGQFFLTNNAASELRARGFTVEQRRKNGQFQYRLLDKAEGVAREKTGAEHAQEAAPSALSSRPSHSPQSAPSPRAACSPIQLELTVAA